MTLNVGGDVVLGERERIYLPHIITTITSTIVNITEAGCQRGTWPINAGCLLVEGVKGRGAHNYC